MTDCGQAGSRAVTPASSIGLGQPKSHQAAWSLGKTVFFVGFMGAGKTSVSRRLSRMCGLVAVDMDTYIERMQDKTVSQIFAEAGEEGFRALETCVLGDFIDGDPKLVGCGGGVVMRPENRQLLCGDNCFVVFLKVTADEARERISDLSTRPLFNDVESARQLNEQRLPLYEEVADAIVETAGKDVAAIAREVRRILQKEGVLCRQQG